MDTKINEKLVQKVAHMAKLNFTKEQLPYFTKEIQKTMDLFQDLDQVDTTGVKPTYSVTDQLNVMRPDKPIDYGQRNALLKNAPDIMDGLLRVPVIVKQQKNER